MHIDISDEFGISVKCFSSCSVDFVLSPEVHCNARACCGAINLGQNGNPFIYIIHTHSFPLMSFYTTKNVFLYITTK